MALMSPNRVVLISRGRYNEAKAGADCYPGMFLAQDNLLQVIPHNIVGGGGVIRVAIEDALRGATMNQKLPSGSDGTPFLLAARGDLLTMLLQNGQNVGNGAALMSAGDGTLTLDPTAVSSTLYQIVAPSADVTNTGAETTFSNGSFVIPANSLQPGDVLHLRGRVVVSAENSTNTHRFRLYIGATVLIDTGALQMAAADYFDWDVYLTIRSVGATGKFVMMGFKTTTVSGTPTTTQVTLGSTTVDTTVAQTIKVTGLASAASAGNVAALQEYQADQQGAGGSSALFFAQEAKDNSLGTGTSDFNHAMPTRVIVA